MCITDRLEIPDMQILLGDRRKTKEDVISCSIIKFMPLQVFLYEPLVDFGCYSRANEHTL
jgi:hypothetical protein